MDGLAAVHRVPGGATLPQTTSSPGLWLSPCGRGPVRSGQDPSGLGSRARLVPRRGDGPSEGGRRGPCARTFLREMQADPPLPASPRPRRALSLTLRTVHSRTESCPSVAGRGEGTARGRGDCAGPPGRSGRAKAVPGLTRRFCRGSSRSAGRGQPAGQSCGPGGGEGAIARRPLTELRAVLGQDTALPAPP